jgi:outer membrane protein
MKKQIIGVLLSMIYYLVALPLAGIAQESTTMESSIGENPDAPAVIDWAAMSILDLDTAVMIALYDNPGLGAAAARVRQAKAQVDQARSTYWPRLDANVVGDRLEVSNNAFRANLDAIRFQDPNATLDNPRQYYNADLIASWTLFDGFERNFSNAAARYGEQSSTAALNDARRLLISAVALSYYAAQLARKNIAIAEANEEFNQRQIVDAEARQRVGTGLLTDVLNFQVRKNEAKTNRISEEYRYEIALYGLAALMGLPQSRLPAHVDLARLMPETSAELSEPPLDNLITNALDHRPDIQQTRWDIQQTEAQIKIAQSGYYPKVVLAGRVDGEQTDTPNFNQDNFGNSLRVDLSYNLFAVGFTRAKVREARQRQVELKKRLEDLVLRSTSDIRSAAALVTTAQAQLALQRENTQLVRRTRDLVEKEYNAGQASLVRLNEAQRDLITAESNLALARVGLRQAWIELETRTGNILAKYGPPDGP